MCRQPVTMFIRNIFASKVLAPLKCECRACGSQFTLDLAKEHAKTCTEIEIGCSLCAEQIKRANELAHSQVCPMRRVTCECGQVVTRREQKRHKESVCEFTKIGCPLKCGQEVERCLIPSHTLQCSEVAPVCPVDGCGELVRRGDIRSHVEEKLARHFVTLKKYTSSTLWKLYDPVPPKISPKSTGKIGVFKWVIPSNTLPHKKSPSFKIWERTWTLLHRDKTIALEYTQGVEPVHMSVSFIFKTPNSSHVSNIPVVKLSEGKMVRATEATATNIKELIVKMELLKPIIS
ncbi:TNF receptor-associated factor 6-like [Acropora muricata]|uniref:TNF receptor-associated factor 6-like n=1 Tax=Acropora muricata TaxID=159855 RepID=UPI0034E5F661